MAIEKFTLDSAQDVADVIDGLHWFDSVTVSDTTVTCTKDGIDHLIVNVAIVGGQSATGSPGITFYTKGNSESGNRTLLQSFNYLKQRFAVRTKNGIIFATHASVANGQLDYVPWMLAKTTNEKIAVVIPFTNSPAAYGERFGTAAIDETSQDVSYGYISLINQTTNASRWTDGTQIVGCPIPTHPLSGTSVIKNGMGFIQCPPVSFGSMMINGTEYATNGVFALNDEN